MTFSFSRLSLLGSYFLRASFLPPIGPFRVNSHDLSYIRQSRNSHKTPQASKSRHFANRFIYCSIFGSQCSTMTHNSGFILFFLEFSGFSINWITLLILWFGANSHFLMFLCLLCLGFIWLQQFKPPEIVLNQTCHPSLCVCTLRFFVDSNSTLNKICV